MTVVWIIAIICAIFLIGVIVFFAYVSMLEKKHKDGKHHCNRCEVSFVLTKKDRSRTYCPYCRNKLTKHKKNLREDNENDGKRNEENPFSDCSN